MPTIIKDGTPANIYLTISDIYGVANFSEATVTWTVAGTSLSKSTADHTIFFAHPIYQQIDNNLPCFIIRIYHDEIAAITAGDYTYTLNITYRDVVGLGSAITRTYTGTITFAATAGPANVSKTVTLQVP